MKDYEFSLNVGKIKHICSSYINSKAKELNVTSAQAIYLKFLLEPKQPSQKDISTWLGCDKAQTSRILLGLLEKGYVKQIGDAKDNRKKLYQITEEGKKVSSKVDKELHYLMDSIMFENFAPEEKDIFLKALQKISINIDKFNEGDNDEKNI